ncbi:MAG TPA: ATP-binding cassette domain-containing protein [Candidatus Dormibacteraeota bacterium]|nr:ATP-binding cassette domain-containing protein [Candidatus Dormibacteraeota bacterium]
MTETVIEARGLVKSYGDIEAVRGIDLEVRAGEIFGFLGPNGAGKSTTISMLCTLLTPTAGSAKVAGIDVVRDPSAVRRRIGLVFQDPSLDDQLTGRENLEFHAFVYGVPAADRRRRIDEMLALLQLSDRAGSLVKTYSGGMKRRLEIARGMLHQPQVLFLDEPTLGLDPQTRQSIWTHLNGLRANRGVTIFMTTHYMDEAEYCDRIAIIDRGQIVALGTPDELKKKVGGDVVVITSSQPDAAAAEIKRMLRVEATRDDGTLRMEVRDGKAFVPRLVRELTAPVETVSMHRPSLDDVFLKLTGHAIREEEASSGDRNRAMARRWAAGRRR